MADLVTLTLAHPISEAQAAQLRATEVKDYPTPGMSITLPRDQARSLIDVGYVANVDPQDHDQVRKAIEVKPTAKTKS